MLDRTVEIILFSEIIFFASLGVFGSIFMILSFCCTYQWRSKPSNKKKKNNFLRMVLYLGISDLILSLAIIYTQINYGIFPNGNYNEDNLLSVLFCKSQAAVVLFAQISKLLWLFSFAIALFLNVLLVSCWRKGYEFYRNKFFLLEIFLYFFNWGIPLLISIVLTITNQLGKSYIGCWVSSDNKYLPFVIYYGPLFVVFFATFIMYIFVVIIVCVTRSRTDSMIRKKGLLNIYEKNKQAIKLSTYILVFLILWTPAVTGTIYNYATNNPFQWLLYPQFLWTIGGFFDGIVYSIKKSPRFSKFLTCCCYTNKRSSIDKYNSNEEHLLENPTSIPILNHDNQISVNSNIPSIVYEPENTFELEDIQVTSKRKLSIKSLFFTSKSTDEIEEINFSNTSNNLLFNSRIDDEDVIDELE